MLQHIIRHSFAEREASSWLPTETAQTRNRSQQLSPEKAECPLPRTESVARRTPQRSQGPEPTPSRGERCATGRPAMEVCRNCTFSDVCRWQDIDAMHSQAPGDGRICAKCVLGRLVVAIFSRDAFSSALPWQDSAAVRPRAAVRGRFCAPCIPKAASGGKTASSRQDSRAMHPKTGWLWQDMRAMRPKCPANRRRRIHRAKILPGRGAFRCAGPSNHARRANLAIQRRRSALAPATPAPPNSASCPQTRRRLCRFWHCCRK